MRDLRSFYVRANTCVACHQNLESDLLDAGHPQLLFELDSQSILYRTLWLFAGAFAAAVAVLGFIIWMTVRKGAKEAATSPGP